MSVVWRGYDEVLGRQVAVKVLAPTLAPDAAFRHRIRTEAQAAARLCHPHITNVYDYGEAEYPEATTVPYVVMELIDGESMAARLRDGAALPWREAVTACAEVASALAVAHARGVVHRDVTPNNVMLTTAGAKVVDFGISALVGENDVGPDGTLLGTPAYLAPERMDAGVVSPATDVYALGLLLYRSLTGRLPWRAATTTQMLKAHRYTDPEPVPPVDGLPVEVVELTRRCLAKRPADRPSSADVARTLAGAAGLIVFLPGPVRAPAIGAVVPDPEKLNGLGTTILPWSAPTSAVPRALPVPIPRRPAALRRRLAAGLAAVALITTGGVVWSGVSQSAGDVRSPGGAVAQPLALGVGEPPIECRVSYKLRRDTGARFNAAVGITNTGGQAVDDWRLEFAFPGRQRMLRGAGGYWQQVGQQVSVRPLPARGQLAPGATARLGVTASYEGPNALPVIFRVNDSPCRAVVAGLRGGETADPRNARRAAASNDRDGSSDSDDRDG
jgi:serine/threonine-protein kinase